MRVHSVQWNFSLKRLEIVFWIFIGPRYYALNAESSYNQREPSAPTSVLPEACIHFSAKVNIEKYESCSLHEDQWIANQVSLWGVNNSICATVYNSHGPVL